MKSLESVKSYDSHDQRDLARFDSDLTSTILIGLRTRIEPTRGFDESFGELWSTSVDYGNDQVLSDLARGYGDVAEWQTHRT